MLSSRIFFNIEVRSRESFSDTFAQSWSFALRRSSAAREHLAAGEAAKMLNQLEMLRIPEQMKNLILKKQVET